MIEGFKFKKGDRIIKEYPCAGISPSELTVKWVFLGFISFGNGPRTLNRVYAIIRRFKPEPGYSLKVMRPIVPGIYRQEFPPLPGHPNT